LELGVWRLAVKDALGIPLLELRVWTLRHGGQRSLLGARYAPLEASLVHLEHIWGLGVPRIAQHFWHVVASSLGAGSQPIRLEA